MSAVWSKVGDKIKRHDGRRPMFAAAVRVNIAIIMKGVDADSCGIYRRDPAKNPGESNILPAKLAKARAKAAKS